MTTTKRQMLQNVDSYKMLNRLGWVKTTYGPSAAAIGWASGPSAAASLMLNNVLTLTLFLVMTISRPSALARTAYYNYKI